MLTLNSQEDHAMNNKTSITALSRGLYGEGSESCYLDRYKAICHPRRRHGYICFSENGVFIQAQGI